MNVDCVIGIDVGKGGGITYWRPNHHAVSVKMPATAKDFNRLLDYIKEISQQPICFVEKVQVRVDDLEENKGKIFRIKAMLQNYEQLKAVLELAGVPYIMVHPMKWQNALNLRIKGKKVPETKAERKRRYRDIAQDLYPEIKATLWNADATLIMHFGRYALKNDLNFIKGNLPEEQRSGLLSF